MAIGILGPLNGVIYKTTEEIINTQISSKVASVLTTFIKSSFEALDTVLQKVQNLTKEEPAPGGQP
jgi:hypothetical protein